jgi:phosphatidylinositol-3,4,5-trisphosphate 3-phosphatase/dual-specificity protein phosphatase PTEN
MDSFSSVRCKDSRGVTIPSQRRYIEYYADYLQNNRQYDNVSVRLESIEINVPKKLSDEFPKTLKLQIYKESFNKIFESNKHRMDSESNKFLFQFENSLVLNSDIKFSFLKKDKAGKVYFIEILKL